MNLPLPKWYVHFCINYINKNVSSDLFSPACLFKINLTSTRSSNFWTNLWWNVRGSSRLGITSCQITQTRFLIHTWYYNFTRIGNNRSDRQVLRRDVTPDTPRSLEFPEHIITVGKSRRNVDLNLKWFPNFSKSWLKLYNKWPSPDHNLLEVGIYTIP